MKVEVKKIYLENYKKFPSKSVDLFPRTEISGRNREGKSTLKDAYLDVLTGKMANGTEPTSIRRKENGLEVLEEVCPLSARMVVNQVSQKMEQERISKIIVALKKILDEKE